MTETPKGIGGRYQAETKYTRESLSGYAFDTVERAGPFKEYPDARQTFPLPAFRAGEETEFWEVIARRRSERQYQDTPLGFSELALLVFATQGVTARHGEYLFRTSPSAGALYPIETYLLASRVETLPQGVYHLNIVKNSLELIHRGNRAGELAAAALGQSMVAQGAVTFVWTAIPGRSTWKYRERAYRYLYLDAGHIGQNLYLAAGALNLGCCTIGAFFDEEVNSIIGVDGVEETAVYMGVVGKTK